MKKTVFLILLAGLIMSGCALRTRKPSSTAAVPTDQPTGTSSPLPPTETPSPTATVTPTHTPDFSSVGLPAEPSGDVAFDFVGQMCNATWFSSGEQLPCPGDDSQQGSGYVTALDATIQELPSDLSILLTFPPATGYGTLYSKYPAFTVEKGDRFRAALTCRAHSFCDVQFGLEYYDGQGKTGLRHWQYLFADSPIVVDYPLDGLAGKSVQFSLIITAKGNPSNAYAVWIAPHIYRPAR